MRDLAIVDRQLAEFGSELDPKRVRALLDRILGTDRSLARLSELLESLGAPSGNTPRPAPMLRDPLAGVRLPSPRPAAPPVTSGDEARKPRSDAPPVQRLNPPGVRSSLPPRIVSPLAPVQGDELKTATPWPPVASVQTPMRPPSREPPADSSVPPAAEPMPYEEPQFDAATAALFGITGHPAAPSEQAPAAAPEAVAVPPEEAVAAEPALSEPPVSEPPASEPPEPQSRRKRHDTLTGLPGADSSPPSAQPLAFAQPAPAVPPEPAPPRPSMRELLERDLDPRDFPSSHPPPRARSMPPPLHKKQPPPATEDTFEMLIDDSDDEIMEIDDVELEEIE